MSTTGIVLVGVFFLCLFINVPIALALGFSSVAALVMFSDDELNFFFSTLIMPYKKM